MMGKTVTKKLMLFFPLCECDKPIIYHLVKDHNLVVNVFRARVVPDEHGYLALDVTGTEEDIQSGLDFVKTFDVSINETGKGLVRDDNKCAHCGHCITHCPSGALRIDNRATREVVFDKDKCIECHACIRVCIYGACASAF